MHLPIAYPVRVVRSGKRAGIFPYVYWELSENGHRALRWRYAHRSAGTHEHQGGTYPSHIRTHQPKAPSEGGEVLIEGPQCVREALTWQPQIIQDVYVRTDGADPDSPIASTALGKLAGEAMEERIHVHKMTQEVEHRVSHDAQGCLRLPT